MDDDKRWRRLAAVVVGVCALVIVGVGATSWAQSGSGSGSGEADRGDQASVTVVVPDNTRKGGGPPDDRGKGVNASVVEAVDCDEARTHGEYVSSVARTTPGGPGKGAVVSAAASSDCGQTSDD